MTTFRAVNNTLLQSHVEEEPNYVDAGVLEMKFTSDIQKAIEYELAFMVNQKGEDAIKQMDGEYLANEIYEIILQEIEEFK